MDRLKRLLKNRSNMKIRSTFVARCRPWWVAGGLFLLTGAWVMASVLNVPKDQFDHDSKGKTIFLARGWLEGSDSENETLYIVRSQGPNLNILYYNKTRFFERGHEVESVESFPLGKRAAVRVYYWKNPANQRIADEVHAL